MKIDQKMNAITYQVFVDETFFIIQTDEISIELMLDQFREYVGKEVGKR